jgi:hypothetical protein
VSLDQSVTIAEIVEYLDRVSLVRTQVFGGKGVQGASAQTEYRRNLEEAAELQAYVDKWGGGLPSQLQHSLVSNCWKK